jgi:hypothetical protein
MQLLKISLRISIAMRNELLEIHTFSFVDLGASYALHAFELSLFLLTNIQYGVYRNEFSSYAKVSNV